MATLRSPRKLPVIGWREWVAFPGLGIDAIKAKIDTGARTSALHALDIVRLRRRGKDWVRFRVQPFQRNAHDNVTAMAPLLEMRDVRSSNGASSLRCVIETELALAGEQWTIELTLVNRDQMGFRLLLGRQALRHRLLVDCGRSYCDSSRVRRG